MTSFDDRACMDCKHSREIERGDAGKRRRWFRLGCARFSNAPIVDIRRPSGECGTPARLFEPKETT